MPEISSANYVFLPWARQGAAAGIQTPDRSPQQAGVVAVTVSLRVNDEVEPVERQVRLYGPGDVLGIDRQQVVRTEPRHLATDFEPNLFPSVEFDRPDFPWMFTPAKADDAGNLRPWLCLVVVRKQQGVTLRAQPNLPLPVLEIVEPARYEDELPDLAESWAWAHVQVVGSRRDPVSLKLALAGDPALTVSRLLCPRRLDPQTDYLACVVPTFELGRKAGLGKQIEPADESELKPAWISGAQELKLELPVYYSWEFRTGSGGDFEMLVRLLEARDKADMPPEVGKRRVDIGRPGFEIVPPLPEHTTLELAGALSLLDSPVAPWPDETRTPFRRELKAILDAPWQALHEGSEDPLLAPPIYGSWQAARHSVELGPAPSAPWLDELNLDPRHRVVAALGTQVVQQQQEQLMTSAWQQLGEIERVNRLRRQAQFGRAVNGVIHERHFRAFSPQTLLNVVAPAQSRLLATTAETAPALLSRTLARSRIPIRAVSAPLRRLASPRGVASTRFGGAGSPSIGILARMNRTASISFERPPAGLVTLNGVGDAATGLASGLRPFMSWEHISAALDTAPQLGAFQIVPEGFTPRLNLLSYAPESTADSLDARMFRIVARQNHAYMQSALLSTLPSELPEQLDLEGTKAQLLLNLDPKKTITARVQASLSIAGADGPSGRPELRDDPLAPIMDAPEFPQPMYEALRDLAQDYLFPGLEHVPPNTVTLLETNSDFVESFLVGLNAEMSRELLWRNYPTDQRGTYFRQFWDTSAGDGRPDIEAIHRWDAQSELGDNARPGEQLVLLLRGELLRRYPNAVIYAVAAVRNASGRLELSPDPADEAHPLFRGTLKPDVTFLGFGLTKPKALADPGWFFVIQQQPAEPSFGMDAADFTKPLPPLSSWNELNWRHLAATEQQLEALSYASITAQLPEAPGASWGRSAAHQAYITLQRPVRIAIHASRMIKG